MSNQLSVRKNETTTLDWASKGVDVVAERLGLMIVGGKKLSPDERMALAAYSLATGLNPFAGECYYLPGVGPGPGIAGWRTKADEQLEYEAAKAGVPAARSYCEYVEPGEGEARFDPAKGDIAVKAILRDTLTRAEWEKRRFKYFLEMATAGLKDGAWEIAGELVGPEPVWTAVGVVRGDEKFSYDGKPEKMDRYERACKRAEKAAIRKRFPRVSLPEPSGWDTDMIDAVGIEVQAEPRPEGQILAELGFGPDVATEEPVRKQDIQPAPSAFHDQPASEAAWSEWLKLEEKAQSLGVTVFEPDSTVTTGELRRIYGELRDAIGANEAEIPV